MSVIVTLNILAIVSFYMFIILKLPPVIKRLVLFYRFFGIFVKIETIK